VLIGVVAALSAAIAGVELVLEDGRVIQGADVRREGDAYILELEEGGVVPIPSPFVREVRLLGDAKPAEPRREAPTGFVDTPGPQTLAGPTIEPPRTSDQLAVLGRPSRFSQGVVDPTWHPESDWDNDPIKNNNFAPSKWADGVVDSTWEPESAYDGRKDVLDSGRSTFQEPIVDNSWQPQDGFAKKGW
jgi:hypothetical protein